MEERDHVEDRCKWENIKMNIREIGYESGLNWFRTILWWAFVNTVMNFSLP
jgi:hypothetical protein